MVLGFSFCDTVAPLFHSHNCVWYDSLDSLGDLDWSICLAVKLTPPGEAQFLETLHFYTDGSSFKSETELGKVAGWPDMQMRENVSGYLHFQHFACGPVVLAGSPGFIGATNFSSADAEASSIM